MNYNDKERKRTQRGDDNCVEQEARPAPGDRWHSFGYCGIERASWLRCPRGANRSRRPGLACPGPFPRPRRSAESSRDHGDTRMRVEPTEQIVPAMAKARFEHAPAAAAATVAAAARAVGAAAAVRVLRDARRAPTADHARSWQASGVHSRHLDHRHRLNPARREEEGSWGDTTVLGQTGSDSEQEKNRCAEMPQGAGS